MLDKSIPYKDIVMRLEAVQNPMSDAFHLPDGYAFRFYRPGDEVHWAAIETSVLEFDSRDGALEYFNRTFKPYPTELTRRCVFITNGAGIPVATATAWWVGEGENRQAALHWVAVRPEYQGKGLGKTVVRKVLTLFHLYEKGRDIYLHTQTWSHAAVRMYYDLGFRMVKTGGAGGTENDYPEAVEILRGVLGEEMYRKLTCTAL